MLYGIYTISIFESIFNAVIQPKLEASLTSGS